MHRSLLVMALVCGACTHDIDSLMQPDDAGSEDAGSEDAGSEDAGSEDAGSEDAGSSDAASEDGGARTLVIESAPDTGDPCPPVMGVRNCSGVGIGDFWILWRFSVPAGGMTVTEAGFEGTIDRGSFFVGFVPLASTADHPEDPTLSSGTAAPPTLFMPPPTAEPTPIPVGFDSLVLAAGAYAVVFGTNAFGASNGSGMVVGEHAGFVGENPTSFRPDRGAPDFIQQAAAVRIWIHGVPGP